MEIEATSISADMPCPVPECPEDGSNHGHALCTICREAYTIVQPARQNGQALLDPLGRAVGIAVCRTCGYEEHVVIRRYRPIGKLEPVRPELGTQATDLVDAADIPEVDPLWGPWHAKGESLLIAAPTGRGKTTLAMRYVRAALGADPPELLGETVTPRDRVLYLMVDRALQQRRFLARLWAPAERETYRDRLLSWLGPLPIDVARDPWKLAEFCYEVGKAPGLVVVDVIEGVVPGVYGAEGAGQYAQARESVISQGMDVIDCHHLRKPGGEQEGSKPTSEARIYGGRQLADRAGGVLLLWSKKPDSNVLDLDTLKSPVGRYPRLRIELDRDRHLMEVVGDVTEVTTKDQRQELILRQAVATSEVRLVDLSPLFDVTPRTLQRDLSEMVEGGKLEAVGEPTDPDRVYRPARFNWQEQLEDVDEQL